MSDVLLKEKYGSTKVSKQYLESDRGVLKVERSTTKQWNAVSNSINRLVLPVGYPKSVSKDYTQYHFWDTIQTFSSIILAALATQTVLTSMKVLKILQEEEESSKCIFVYLQNRLKPPNHSSPYRSALSAMSQMSVGTSSILLAAFSLSMIGREVMSTVTRILFVWFHSKELDGDCKRWRLISEILKDAVIFLEIAASFHPTFFYVIIGVSSVFKAIVTIAGGATRLALQEHMSLQHNMADLAVKISNRDILVTAVAVVFYLLLIPLIAFSKVFMWFVFVFFTILHLYANYRAVTSVTLATMNLARLHLIIEEYIVTGQVLSVEIVNGYEPLLRKVKWRLQLSLGCSAEDAIESHEHLLKLEDIYKDSNYLLNLDIYTKSVQVLFTDNADCTDVLKALVQFEVLDYAMMFMNTTKHLDGPADTCCHMRMLIDSALNQDETGFLIHSYQWVYEHFGVLYEELDLAGWDVYHPLVHVDEWRIDWQHLS